MKTRSVIPALMMVAGAAAMAATGTTRQPTFSRDVAPILQKNCQGCHRPGEAAPMSLLTYQQVRPWAKAIREAVLLKRMPPWFADPSEHGMFKNDRSLAPSDIETLVSWVDAGAPQGDPNDLPAPRHFVDGWNIGQPDAVFEMPNEFQVPASGTIEYQYIVVPTGFTEDKWVQMAEVRPGNRALVHHVIAFVRPPDSRWMREAQPGIPFVPKKEKDENQAANPDKKKKRDDGGGFGEFLVGFAPGVIPEMLEPGQAKLIKAGSDFVFQLHYTANGKAGTDQTKIGLIFAKEPPKVRVLTASAQNRKFTIPAGDPDYEVRSEITIQDTATLTGLLPHMHLRGKDFEYRLVYPTGESEVLLKVPKYSFSWQLSYYLEKPRVLVKGARIECTAHFDNSPNNPSNPNPNVDVKWGDQSWEEMMIGFFDLAVKPDVKLEDLFKDKDKKPAPARSSD